MIRMLAVSVALGLGTVAVLPVQARDVTPGAEDMAAVVRSEGQAFVDKKLTDGLSIAIVRDGQTTFYNFGTVSRDTPKAPDQNTVYEIGSISKTFGSLLLAQAIDEGKIKPGDDVRLYLPGSYPNLVKDGHPLRLIDLVTTTSALPDNLPAFANLIKGDDASRRPFQIADGLATYSTEVLLKDLHGVTLSGVPGTMRAHSNVGAQLVGVAVAHIRKTSYEQALSKYIEQPLGMHSGVALPHGAPQATGYDEHGAVMPYLTAPVIVAAGGLRYSPADMARYIGMQLDPKNSAVARTHELAWGTIGEGAMGYNWNVDRTVDGEPRMITSGGTFGFSSLVDLYPASRYGIVFLTNRGGGNTQGELAALSERIVRRTWGESPALALFRQQLDKRGFDHIDDAMAATLVRYPRIHLSEGDINLWGYRLLSEGKTRDAVAMFAFNTRRHPKSGNAFDSLGEAQRAAGDKAPSIASYRQSLALDPSNDHARKQLAEMGANEAN